jgi:hypothetical protein
MTAQEYLVTVAKSYIGYKEKASTKDLDSFTANAGTRNYTRFARALDAIKGFYNGKKQGVAWCDVFVDAVFTEAFGNPTGRKMLYQPEKSLGAGVRYSRGYFKKKNRLFADPLAGDQIFFTDPAKGDINYGKHTGIVTGFDAAYVYTVEGNANNAVSARKYKLSDPSISGYGRPDWSLVAAQYYGAVLYTVTIPGLTEAQADGLVAAWPRATKAVG